jgi:hypothetical protein
VKDPKWVVTAAWIGLGVTVGLMLVLVLWGVSRAEGAEVEDSFQRAARSAKEGKWGVLKPWQLEWYNYGLAHQLKVQGRAKVTSYGPWESDRMSGGPFCWLGSRRVVLGSAHCAADRGIPKGSIVWTNYGLRFVVDRGGWVKVGGSFTSSGETANLDYWSPRELSTLRQTPYVILRRGW